MISASFPFYREKYVVKPRIEDSTVQQLLKPGEVAKELRVDAKTVRRWAKTGKLSYVTTLGGHHRYFKAEIEKLRVDMEGHPHDHS